MVLVVLDTGKDAAAACAVDESRYHQAFSDCVEVVGRIGLDPF